MILFTIDNLDFPLDSVLKRVQVQNLSNENVPNLYENKHVIKALERPHWKTVYWIIKYQMQLYIFIFLEISIMI